MTDSFQVSRGSLPGWLSCAVIVIGIVGYFFYERASDEKWMALEDKQFEGITDRLSQIEGDLVAIRVELGEHRGHHNAEYDVRLAEWLAEDAANRAFFGTGERHP